MSRFGALWAGLITYASGLLKIASGCGFDLRWFWGLALVDVCRDDSAIFDLLQFINEDISYVMVMLTSL